jgi:hypothetical protein
LRKRKNNRFFVIVFRIGAEVLEDYGWAPDRKIFLSDIRRRVKRGRKYEKISKRISFVFYRYQIEEITHLTNWPTEGKRTIPAKNKPAIKRIVAELKRIL